MLRLCLFLLTMSGISTVAEARGLPMKAQNRAHLGGLWSPGTYAVNLGFDSRMTQSISMDVGSFIKMDTRTVR